MKLQMNSVLSFFLFTGCIYGACLVENQEADVVSFADVVDSTVVLKDTVIDCNQITVEKRFVHELDTPVIYGSNWWVSSCTPDLYLRTNPNKIAYWTRPISCKHCGLESDDVVQYDSLESKVDENGCKRNLFIKDGVVIEEVVFIDQIRKQKKNYILDSIIDGISRICYLNSIYYGDSLMKRSVNCN